ncbi:FAD-dependent monooxygenase [Streptomyces sp. NPDC004126]|uniref:FAD-dependent monooxygenase n=1 Tax=Streptomyces sp. NPDC004126 TaxID=3390695 RepID=UPI003D01257A
MRVRILVSGAGVAGPVLAHWLTRYGFCVTVVERAPAPRRTGGHAVDLFRPAMDISQRMGLLRRIEERAVGTRRMTVHQEGARRPVRADLSRIFRATSGRHVEIMRDDLTGILHDATRDDVAYVFGDSITAISPDGEVSFENAAPRRFDLVIGADGLHSNVRRLVFGDEARFGTSLGAHLGVMTLPNTRGLDGELLLHVGVGRTAGMYGVSHMGDARVLFLFRGVPESEHPRGVPRQKELLHAAFTGMHPDVDRWLDGRPPGRGPAPGPSPRPAPPHLRDGAPARLHGRRRLRPDRLNRIRLAPPRRQTAPGLLDAVLVRPETVADRAVDGPADPAAPSCGGRAPRGGCRRRLRKGTSTVGVLTYARSVPRAIC